MAEPPAVKRGVEEAWLGSDEVEEGEGAKGEVGDCDWEEDAKGLGSDDMASGAEGLIPATVDEI